MKNKQSKLKPIKIVKQPGTTYCFGCKDFTHNFRPQEVKMTNKVLREKSHQVKNKIKTYCVKCTKDTENINAKMVRTKNDRLIMQSKCSVYIIKKSRFVK